MPNFAEGGFVKPGSYPMIISSGCVFPESPRLRELRTLAQELAAKLREESEPGREEPEEEQGTEPNA